MAVTCARCGTQNPDGNQFCQACGTPLAVVAAPPAPGAVLPGPPPGPPPPQAGYQSPYYAPSAVGPQPPVHRTPWILIISAIVVLVVLMAGCGTAIAVFSNRASGQGNSPGLLPSPSRAGTPSPVASPSPVSTRGGTASNKGETFILPTGWTVQSQDDETILITNPNGDGSVTVGSGASSPAQTAQQNKDTIDKFFLGKYPDTKTCAGTKTTTGTLNGAAGIFWELCFTLSSGGQSVQAEAPLFAGANSSGSVYYIVLLLTSQANVQTFINDATPILQSIKWKLT
jgi:zinc-ribbon domain